MRKTNCWEHKHCGRGPGEENVHAHGTCPAATERRAHGVNGGRNGGRGCWAIAGSFCKGSICGTYAAMLSDCMECDFFRRVGSEEGPDYMGAKAIFAQIHMHHTAHARSARPRTARKTSA